MGREVTPGTDPRGAGPRTRRRQVIAPRSPVVALDASSGTPPIRREALLGRLDALTDDVGLVVLEAPAGYGKTTTVRQWTESRAEVVRWVQVTAKHAHPGLLAAALLDAVLAVGAPPGVRPAPTRRVRPAEHLVSRLVEIARTRPVLLVLEDLYRAGGNRAVRMVAALAEALPPGSRVVVTTDRPLRWRLGKLVADGRCVEFGSDDLRFDAAETAALLAAAGVHPPPAVVVEFVRRTDGWPMGLHLALPALAATAEPATVVSALDGDDAVFADYFRRRVLAGLPAETIRFLTRTAVLETVTGSLCDTVLGTPGSAARLADMRALGLFVTPLGGSGDWYRYHPLFAQMLRGDLQRREPGTDLSIHRSASLWYERAGQPETAIEHALEGRGDVTAGRLLVAHTQALNSQGRISEVRHWLDRVDDDVVAGYPPLGPTAAWAWALTGDVRRARRALALAEGGSFDGPLPDGSASLESAVLRARAALAPRGVGAMLDDARRAVLLEPVGSPWQSQAAMLLGVAQWLNGAPEQAVRSLEAAQQFGTASQRPGAAFALGQLAWIAAYREDWSMAEACVDESSELIRALGLDDYMPSLLTYLVAALVAQRRRQPDQVIRWTDRAAALYAVPSPAAFPWLAVQAAVGLGRLELDLGDRTAAGVRLADARAHLRGLQPGGVLADVVAGFARSMGEAARHEDVGDRGSLTPAEAAVLRLLPSHLSLEQIGDELVVTRNTVKGHVDAIYRKLGAGSRAEAVRRARQGGLLDE